MYRSSLFEPLVVNSLTCTFHYVIALSDFRAYLKIESALVFQLRLKLVLAAEYFLTTADYLLMSSNESFDGLLLNKRLIVLLERELAGLEVVHQHALKHSIAAAQQTDLFALTEGQSFVQSIRHPLQLIHARVMPH